MRTYGSMPPPRPVGSRGGGRTDTPDMRPLSDGTLLYDGIPLLRVAKLDNTGRTIMLADLNEVEGS
jgi:hypothetical protein